MNCPNCKKEELLPARTHENKPTIDGMKCPGCDSLYLVNESNHLVPVRPFESHALTLARDAVKKPQKLEDLQPGITREGFFKVLKTVTRPIKEPTPTLTQIASFQKPSKVTPAAKKERGPYHHSGEYHYLTDEEKTSICLRLQAGEKPYTIAKDMRVKPWQIYYYRDKLESEGKLTMEPGKKKSDAVKLAENWLASDKCTAPTLTIRMANNGVIVTDMDGDEFTYTSLKDLLQCITDFFGEPVSCNPTRGKP